MTALKKTVRGFPLGGNVGYRALKRSAKRKAQGIPANQNFPFLQTPKRLADFGRRNPLARMHMPIRQPLPQPLGWTKAIRGVLPFGLAFGLAEYAYEVYSRRNGRKPIVPGGWEWCVGPADCAGYTWVTPPYFASIGSCGLSACLGGQAAMSPGINPSQLYSHYVRNYDRGILPPRSVILGSVRKLPGADATVPYVAAPMVWEAPQVWVADPMLMPADWFAPQTRPIPYELIPARVDNPYRAPSERTETGPRSQPVPISAAGSHNPPWNTVARTYRRGVTPVDTLKMELPKPPKRGEKERKASVTRGAQNVLRVVENLTEAQDMLDAFYYALPKEYRPRGATPLQRDMLLLQYYEQVDLNKAIENVIKQQVGDMVFGMLGKGYGSAARRGNQIISGGWGGGDRRGLLSIAEQKAKSEEAKRRRLARREERIKREIFRSWKSPGGVLTYEQAAWNVDKRTDVWLKDQAAREAALVKVRLD